MQGVQLQQLFRDKYRSRWSPRFLADVTRLDAGEPLDYVIGWAPFLGCRIDLSARPLIPRTETEFWTEKFILRHATRDKRKAAPLHILDVFAGSGCVGLAILKHMRTARVDFADIDAKVLRGTKISARKNRIAPKRYRIIHSDVLKNIRGRYDTIVANPPYIARENIRRVQTSVLTYEPHKALFGGRDGLYFIKKLLHDAPKHLLSNGELWMEFDPHEKPAIAKLLTQLHYRDVQFHKDQYKKWRFVTARTPLAPKGNPPT